MIKKLSLILTIVLLMVLMPINTYAASSSNKEKYLSSFEQDIENSWNWGVAIKWQPKSKEYKYFEVYISDTKSSGYVKRGQYKTNLKEWKINSLKSGKAYYVKIKLFKKKTDKEGVWSKVYKVYTKPGSTKNIKQTTGTQNTVTIRWDKVDTADGYRVYGVYENDSTMLKDWDFERLITTSKNTCTLKYNSVKKYDSLIVATYIKKDNGSKIEGSYSDGYDVICLATKPKKVDKNTMYLEGTCNFLWYTTDQMTTSSHNVYTEIEIYKYNDLKNPVFKGIKSVQSEETKVQTCYDIEKQYDTNGNEILMGLGNHIHRLDFGVFYKVKVRNYSEMYDKTKLYSDWTSAYFCTNYRTGNIYLDNNSVKLKFQTDGHTKNKLPSGVSGIEIYAEALGSDESKLVKVVNKKNPTEITISGFADGTPFDTNTQYTIRIYPYRKVNGKKYIHSNYFIDTYNSNVGAYSTSIHLGEKRWPMLGN